MSAIQPILNFFQSGAFLEYFYSRPTAPVYYWHIEDELEDAYIWWNGAFIVSFVGFGVSYDDIVNGYTYRRGNLQTWDAENSYYSIARTLYYYYSLTAPRYEWTIDDFSGLVTITFNGTTIGTDLSISGTTYTTGGYIYHKGIFMESTGDDEYHRYRVAREAV